MKGSLRIVWLALTALLGLAGLWEMRARSQAGEEVLRKYERMLKVRPALVSVARISLFPSAFAVTIAYEGHEYVAQFAGADDALLPIPPGVNPAPRD